MLAFHVLPNAVSHTFECHPAFLTLSGLHLSQTVSGEYDSFHVIRLTMNLASDANPLNFDPIPKWWRHVFRLDEDSIVLKM